jgi:shikimate dehydrogenase
MTRCAVLGDPISHSLSPLLHRAAYAALDLPWQYDAHRVAAAELAGFVGDLGSEWRGLSLTMPLKQAAIRLCESIEPLAAQVDAVNTMVRTQTGWSGHNTDVGGCVDAVRAAGLDSVERAVVVGSGATAGSVLAALAELGARKVVVLARSAQRAQRVVELGHHWGVDVERLPLEAAPAEPVDVLVSTVPATAQQERAADWAALVRPGGLVFDVVYEPRETPLLSAATRRGMVTVPGTELLLRQAARQVTLMTGVDEAPLAAMRAALAG